MSKWLCVKPSKFGWSYTVGRVYEGTMGTSVIEIKGDNGKTIYASKGNFQPVSPKPTQSIEELIAENVSLGEQIKKLDERRAKKRHFWEKNAESIQALTASALKYPEAGVVDYE